MNNTSFNWTLPTNAPGTVINPYEGMTDVEFIKEMCTSFQNWQVAMYALPLFLIFTRWGINAYCKKHPEFLQKYPTTYERIDSLVEMCIFVVSGANLILWLW